MNAAQLPARPSFRSGLLGRALVVAFRRRKTRRQFLRLAMWAGGAAWVCRHVPLTGRAMGGPVETTSQVSLTGGPDHVSRFEASAGTRFSGPKNDVSQLTQEQ
jgi:hypothetical protein